MTGTYIMYQKDLLMRSYSANKISLLLVVPGLLLLIMAPVRLSAQEQSLILFHVAVIDGKTGEPLYGAHFRSGHGDAGAADEKGLVSFYARPYDTISFSCIGYKGAMMLISDTLHAREYAAGVFLNPDTLQVPEVIVVPRVSNLRTAILYQQTTENPETANAINNLKISAYQGLSGANELGDPSANYNIIRSQQKINAYEKGGISSGSMISVSPFTIIPLVYMLAKGLPKPPDPPEPYISQRELQQIKAMHDSLIYKRKNKTRTE